MLKKNNLICQGTCMSFKLQITILNSYYAYDIMTFSKQHIQVMLFLTIESIIKTKIIFQYIDLIHHRKKMSISFLKIVFFFLTSFVNGTFILPAYSTITEGENDCFLVGFVGKEDFILSKLINVEFR